MEKDKPSPVARAASAATPDVAGNAGVARFDNYLQEGKGLVLLRGVTRDLADADRLCPTGLALAMLNRVAGSAAEATRCSGRGCARLTAVAFDGGGGSR